MLLLLMQELNMKSYLPILVIILFFFLVGAGNIYNRIKLDEELRSIDYLIPALIPLGIIFSLFVFLIIKLSTMVSKNRKK